jgi:hypothetical protein
LAYGLTLGSNGPTLDKFELDHLGGLSFHSPIHAALPLTHQKEKKKICYRPLKCCPMHRSMLLAFILYPFILYLLKKSFYFIKK